MVGRAGDGSKSRLSARMERRGRGRDGLWDRLPVRREWQEDGGMRRRRIQGSAVRTYGMTGGVAATEFGIGCPHEALQDNGEVRP